MLVVMGSAMGDDPSQVITSYSILVFLQGLVWRDLLAQDLCLRIPVLIFMVVGITPVIRTAIAISTG